MADIKILTESELRQCVSLDRALHDRIEHAFSQLEQGDVVMPPVLSMDLPSVNGEVDVKTAFVPGMDNFAIKVSPGFFDNPAKGLPSLNGLMVVLSAETGIVTAVLLDNGYLTDIRTAAAGGVAARHLAPASVQTAGILGTGVQARLQLKALLLEREVQRVRVWGRDRDKAESFAQEQAELHGIPVTVSESIEALVLESQVVITTTPAREPLIRADWLHPGMHITAMGSDAPDKNEIAPSALAAAGYLVVDRVSQSLERGELRSAVAAGVLRREGPFTELSAICAGTAPGRTHEAQITVCDLTGTGVQDTAIADRALQVADIHGLGTLIHS
ncbi:cyclodeaminase [Marinobacterium litorale]|uniref:cyclodeaminase n=1 Tax=Marinobacterium litorale TaxID=404770 RepID=UPI000428E760|nr:cyclodeaminase [Marinobacterium litorale]